MRWTAASFPSFLVSLCLLAVGSGCASRRGPEVIKVLPHYLDEQGRSALSPSLYDRDAYQAELRQHPAQRTGLRFDVQWRGASASDLLLRVDLRGVVSNRVTEVQLQEPLPRAGKFSRWSGLTLRGDRYRDFGDLTAWRATLWQGTNLVAERQSFLW
ncbi:MAG: hypothetical protein RJA22_1219 [Verrucomicrobiota bacterium]